jgi:hypothetical protein
MTSLHYLSLTCVTRNSVYSAASLAGDRPASFLREALAELPRHPPTFFDHEFLPLLLSPG